MAKVMIEPKDAQNVKSLVRMAVENELKILKAGVARCSSKVGDDFEYIRWAGEYETLQQLERDYSDLLGTEVCS